MTVRGGRRGEGLAWMGARSVGWLVGVVEGTNLTHNMMTLCTLILNRNDPYISKHGVTLWLKHTVCETKGLTLLIIG